MKDKVRVGIIGVGQIGKQHVRKYADVPEAEIVAVADLREDEAARVAQENGIPNYTTDYHELLTRDDIDSIDVCLHNRLHARVTIEALEAGKNVYCEKPMSWVYAEAREMADTARRLGRMLHVQIATLYVPEARATKRLIDDGHLGEIYYAKSSFCRRRGRPYVDGYGTAQFVKRSSAGGGALIDVGIYQVSRMMWLLGNPEVLTVSGKTYQKVDSMYSDRRDESGFDVEELGMGLVRLAGDITFFLEQAWAIHADEVDGDYVFGAHGGVRIDPFTYFTTFSDMEMTGTFDVKKADLRWHRCDPSTAGYDESQRHWVWAQLGRVPLLDTAGLALKSALIAEGVYLSSHLGREVTTQEIEDAPAGMGRRERPGVKTCS